MQSAAVLKPFLGKLRLEVGVVVLSCVEFCVELCVELCAVVLRLAVRVCWFR